VGELLPSSWPETALPGMLALVEEQTALGPRVPGCPAHDSLRDLLAGRLSAHADRLVLQSFSTAFLGRTAECSNVIGVFAARGPARLPPLFLVTHYDTRPIADRDPDPTLRDKPIPGANDGGSGTAVLQHLLPRIREHDPRRDVVVAFLDAEDLGNISGNPFSQGADQLASRPPDGVPAPGEVVALDMVGGAGMILDIDAHAIRHRPSQALTARVFAAGVRLGLPGFTRDKPSRVKYVISDHWPFLRRGVPACILIDMDYPEWHTHADMPSALSARSMESIEGALLLYLSRPEG
jgi:glutaminyl-peptide cyclotransferase